MTDVPTQRRGGECAAGFGLSLLGAALAGTWASLRVAAEGGSLPLVWLAVAGSGALLLGPAVGLARAARPFGPTWTASILSVALAVPMWALLGRILKASTNHRPLGATTFAVVGLVLLCGCLALASRVVSGAADVDNPQVRWYRYARMALIAVAGLVTLGLLGSVLIEPAVRGGAVDGVLLVLAAIAVIFAPIPRALQARALIIGPGMWVLAVIAALVVMRSSADVRSRVVSDAPIYGSLSGWLVSPR